MNLSADLKFYALVTYIYVSGNCYCRLTNACRAVLLVSKCLALMDLLSYAFYHYQTKGPSSSLLYLVYIYCSIVILLNNRPYYHLLCILYTVHVAYIVISYYCLLLIRQKGYNFVIKFYLTLVLTRGGPAKSKLPTHTPRLSPAYSRAYTIIGTVGGCV